MDRNDSSRELVAGHQRALVRTAYLLTGAARQAGDLLRSVLLKMLGRWSRLSRVEHPEAYAPKALVNRRISWRRRRVRSELPTAELPDRSYSSEDSTVVRLVMRRALMRLPPRQRAVIVLRYYEDRTERETAELMSCSIGAVKSQAHYALARLRELAPGPAPGRTGLRDSPLAISRDGWKIAYYSATEGTFQVRDPASGQKTTAATKVPKARPGSVSRLMLSDDGRFVAFSKAPDFKTLRCSSTCVTGTSASYRTAGSPSARHRTASPSPSRNTPLNRGCGPSRTRGRVPQRATPRRSPCQWTTTSARSPPVGKPPR
ncbi:SigE family RNA polymerase sigma factor [Streptosporangium sandarakinum]|uniref:SigE family RNA polymerase sigma factor n=1 Tax=Streptosporangium sandarakinum TaxID=1260955 RepID=UPI0033B6A5F2